jgi:RNA polymerase sigma-70 factor, ECF subfamily
LRTFLAAQLYDREDVADLTQEVFLAACQSAQKMPSGVEFGAWLRGIARNKVKLFRRSAVRRHRALERFRDAALSTIEPELEAAAAEDRSDEVGRLRGCIDRLPDRLRAVVLAGLEGDKPVGLAEKLGTTIGAVYAIHYRANQLLRACMKKGTHP